MTTKVKLEMEMDVKHAQALLVFANILTSKDGDGTQELYCALQSLMVGSDIEDEDVSVNAPGDFISLHVVYEAVSGDNENFLWKKRAMDFINWKSGTQ